MGGSTACAFFSTTEDEQVENAETFLVQLSSTDSVDISGGSSIINIEDNDGKGEGEGVREREREKIYW